MIPISPPLTPPIQLVQQLAVAPVDPPAATIPPLGDLVAPTITADQLGIGSQTFSQYFPPTTTLDTMPPETLDYLNGQITNDLSAGVPLPPAVAACVSSSEEGGVFFDSACEGSLSLEDTGNLLDDATLDDVGLGDEQLDTVGNVLDEPPPIGLAVFQIQAIADKLYNQLNGYSYPSGSLYAPFPGAEAIDHAYLWGVGEPRCLTPGCSAASSCAPPSGAVRVNLKAVTLENPGTATKTFQVRLIPCAFSWLGVPTAWSWGPELPWPNDVEQFFGLYLPRG